MLINKLFKRVEALGLDLGRFTELRLRFPRPRFNPRKMRVP